ncbi:ArnT family glycosyltransferase [Micromonospora fluostatini]|uniref:ArnT family glycosyltransferase n=1 Tax=Micromonospora sp. JCM 30529 TaxID=3421643 RepID=UPI003D16F403
MTDSGRGDDGGVVVSTPGQHGRRWPPALDRPAAVAVLLGLAGVGYRLVLLLATVPAANSDEATFGLAALHIATGRERPVFLYGQRYMGMLESYLAAPLVAVAGPGWPVLRLPLLALYALFLVLTWRLSRRLFSPWFATVVVGLLALGSERVVRDQLTAVGGRPEVKVAVLLMLLVAVGLADGRIRRRGWAVAAFGLLAGLAVWSDWLILPYLAGAGLLLGYVLRRELLGRAGVLLLVGFLVGAAPMIADNLVAPPGEDSLSVLRRLSAGTGVAPPLADRVRAGLLTGVPLATGLCSVDGCARWQAWFGVLYPVLLVVAAGLALVAWRRAAGRPLARRVRPVASLALLAGAALTLLAYLRSPLAATAPLDNARYLSVLQLSLPAVLWPLWVAAVDCWRGTVGVAGRLAGALGTAVLAGLTGALLVGTLVFATGTGAARADQRQAEAVADAVRRAGLRAVYGDYWTCNRLVFDTAEEVACAVLDGALRPGQNRYPAYWQRVAAADRPGYVLPAGSPADRRLRAALGDRADAATVAEVGGVRVYHPEPALRPVR